MKIIVSLIIFGLCLNFCFGLGNTPASSANTGFSSLNSAAVKILSGTNSTDTTTDGWDSSTTSTAVAGVLASYTYFIPGTSNSTSYLLGALSSGYSTTGTGKVGAAATTTTQTSITTWRKRTINNTYALMGSDSSEVSVTGDASVSATILGTPSPYAVAPGYLALLTTSVDGTSGSVNNQVYFYLITASTGAAAQTKLTSTADVVGNGLGTSAGVPQSGVSCTTTTFTLGNVFFDIGSNAFFFTYAKQVVTTTTASTIGTCPTGTGTTLSTVNTIYLGGIYLNGSTFWSSPISVSAATAANSPSSLIAGNDNWLSSSNIYIVYKDVTATTTYYSKTTKSTATTAITSFTSLIKDPTATGSGATAVTLTYLPVSVWASNYTYGITLQLQTATGSTPTYAYTYTNFLNGSTAGVDSGLSNSAATGTTDVGGYYGYQLTTGYSVIAYWQSSTSPSPYSYTLATYYANGTVNKTAATIGSVAYAPAQFYEDANGTFWVGWLDVDTANSITGEGYLTYNAFLGSLQGQLNSPSSSAGIVLPAIYAFILLFVAIFAL